MEADKENRVNAVSSLGANPSVLSDKSHASSEQKAHEGILKAPMKDGVKPNGETVLPAEKPAVTFGTEQVFRIEARAGSGSSNGEDKPERCNSPKPPSPGRASSPSKGGSSRMEGSSGSARSGRCRTSSNQRTRRAATPFTPRMASKLADTHGDEVDDLHSDLSVDQDDDLAGPLYQQTSRTSSQSKTPANAVSPGKTQVAKEPGNSAAKLGGHLTRRSSKMSARENASSGSTAKSAARPGSANASPSETERGRPIRRNSARTRRGQTPFFRRRSSSSPGDDMAETQEFDEGELESMAGAPKMKRRMSSLTGGKPGSHSLLSSRQGQGVTEVGPPNDIGPRSKGPGLPSPTPCNSPTKKGESRCEKDNVSLTQNALPQEYEASEREDQTQPRDVKPQVLPGDSSDEELAPSSGILRDARTFERPHVSHGSNDGPNMQRKVSFNEDEDEVIGKSGELQDDPHGVSAAAEATQVEGRGRSSHVSRGKGKRSATPFVRRRVNIYSSDESDQDTSIPPKTDPNITNGTFESHSLRRGRSCTSKGKQRKRSQTPFFRTRVNLDEIDDEEERQGFLNPSTENKDSTPKSEMGCQSIVANASCIASVSEVTSAAQSGEVSYGLTGGSHSLALPLNAPKKPSEVGSSGQHSSSVCFQLPRDDTSDTDVDSALLQLKSQPPRVRFAEREMTCGSYYSVAASSPKAYCQTTSVSCETLPSEPQRGRPRASLRKAGKRSQTPFARRKSSTTDEEEKFDTADEHELSDLDDFEKLALLQSDDTADVAGPITESTGRVNVSENKVLTGCSERRDPGQGNQSTDTHTDPFISENREAPDNSPQGEESGCLGLVIQACKVAWKELLKDFRLRCQDACREACRDVLRESSRSLTICPMVPSLAVSVKPETTAAEGCCAAGGPRLLGKSE